MKVKQTRLSKDVTLMVLSFTSVGLFFAMICWIAAMRLDYSWSNATVFFVGVCVAIVPESVLAAITVRPSTLKPITVILAYPDPVRPSG